MVEDLGSRVEGRGLWGMGFTNRHRAEVHYAVAKSLAYALQHLIPFGPSRLAGVYPRLIPSISLGPRAE